MGNDKSGTTDGERSAAGLRLELRVSESVVVDYLSDFVEGEPRDQKALEALKVGVIAIRSASPTLDTRVVEEKFREVQGSISTCVAEFRTQLGRQLDDLFKRDSGSVPISLNLLFGDDGELARLLKDYFASDVGKLPRLLQSQIGPASDFAKATDPSNKQSVISRIEDVVGRQLEATAKGLTEQFSLDTENSALQRLKVEITLKLDEIRRDNNTLFAELKKELGLREGAATEAVKGTQKGRDFETVLYDYVAASARTLGDASENVTGKVGLLPNCKKGDYVVELGEASGAPGVRIVIEAKKSQSTRFKDAVDELGIAKKNRDAVMGIFAFSRDCTPPEVGDFLRVGDDFFVSVDDDSVDRGAPLLFLDAAYRIGRVMAITSVRKESMQQLDLQKVAAAVDALSVRASRLGDLITKATTMRKNSGAIEESLIELKNDFEERLETIARLLSMPAQDAPIGASQPAA